MNSLYQPTSTCFDQRRAIYMPGSLVKKFQFILLLDRGIHRQILFLLQLLLVYQLIEISKIYAVNCCGLSHRHICISVYYRTVVVQDHRVPHILQSIKSAQILGAIEAPVVGVLQWSHVTNIFDMHNRFVLRSLDFSVFCLLSKFENNCSRLMASTLHAESTSTTSSSPKGSENSV